MADKFLDRPTPGYSYGVRYWDSQSRMQPDRWYKDAATRDKFVSENAVKEKWYYYLTGHGHIQSRVH